MAAATRFISSLLILCALPTAALADVVLDTPALTLVETSRTSIIVDITAGSSGAPGGVWVEWMTMAEYMANGGWTGDIVFCSFTGTPTLNTTSGTGNYVLGPNETVRVEVGDLFDETGYWATYRGELDPGVTYVFRAFANSAPGYDPSPYGADLFFTTQEQSAFNCTFTQGYWKTHPEAWPVASLMLGGVTYTAAQLLDILNTPAQGNGLIFLAHQVIAAKLNLANGATIPVDVQNAIDAADALIGGLVVPPVGGGSLAPSSASALTQTIDEYNNGITGPGHCGATPAEPATWGELKTRYGR